MKTNYKKKEKNEENNKPIQKINPINTKRGGKILKNNYKSINYKLNSFTYKIKKITSNKLI